MRRWTDVRAALAATDPPPPASFFANPLAALPLLSPTCAAFLTSSAWSPTRDGAATWSPATADYAHFAVCRCRLGRCRTGAAGWRHPGELAGHVGDRADADGWDSVRDAALATSAFPCGFPARRFRNPLSVLPRPRLGGAGRRGDPAGLAVNIDLPEAEGRRLRFWCVDGGLLNNEPLECVRTALARLAQLPRARRWPRRPRAAADRPFPDDRRPCPGRAAASRPDVLDALFALIRCSGQHAAFKPQELMLALDDRSSAAATCCHRCARRCRAEARVNWRRAAWSASPVSCTSSCACTTTSSAGATARSSSPTTSTCTVDQSDRRAAGSAAEADPRCARALRIRR